MNAAIYIRTSREFKGEERLSLDEQLQICKERAEAEGLTVSPKHIFRDENSSGGLYPEQWVDLDPQARRKTRAGFSALINAIEKDEIQALIIRKRNRLMRGLKLHLQFYELLKKKGVRLYATHEQVSEGSDAASELSVNVLALLAEFQLKETTEHLKAIKAYQRKNRMKMGPVFTVGYKDGIDATGKKIVEVDPITAPIVQKVFEKFIEGMSFRELAEWLNNEYPRHHPRIGKRWHISTVRRMLTNPHYLGYDDIDKQGPSLYPAILEDADTFYVAQAKAKDRFREHLKSGKVHILSGLLSCGYCGQTMVIYSRYEKGKRIGFEYKCRGKHSDEHPFCMNETEWEKFINSFFAFTKHLEGSRKMADRGQLEAQLQKVVQSFKPVQAKFSKGEITSDEYFELTELLRERRNQLESQIKGLAQAVSQSDIQHWHSLTDAEKAVLLRRRKFKGRVFGDRVGIYLYEPEDERCSPDYLFPLMIGRESSESGRRGHHCLVPRLLGKSEASSLLTLVVDENEIVYPMWDKYLNDKTFFYANPEEWRQLDKKTCTKCGKIKEMEAFPRSKRASDGRTSHCKACTKVYRDSHREQLRTYKNLYRQREREQSAKSNDHAV